MIFFAPDGDHGACTGFRSDTYLLNDYSFIFSEILSARFLARIRTPPGAGLNDWRLPLSRRRVCKILRRADGGHRRTRLKVILVRSKSGFVRGPRWH